MRAILKNFTYHLIKHIGKTEVDHTKYIVIVLRELNSECPTLREM